MLFSHIRTRQFWKLVLESHYTPCFLKDQSALSVFILRTVDVMFS
jgi:hypothetical protein